MSKKQNAAMHMTVRAFLPFSFYELRASNRDGALSNEGMLIG